LDLLEDVSELALLGHLPPKWMLPVQRSQKKLPAVQRISMAACCEQPVAPVVAVVYLMQSCHLHLWQSSPGVVIPPVSSA